MKNLNLIDLFCGAGGFSNGFKKAGYNVLVGIDNDKKALETYQQNHHETLTILKDLTQINFKKDVYPLLEGKNIDLIIGGPPCQGMSVSGNRILDDPRNKLYLSMIKIIEEVQPKAFVIENVPGLVGLFNGLIKDDIIKMLSEIGYKVTWQILTASDYGVPQTRKRVFFIGLRDKEFVFPKTNIETITTEMALSDLPPLVNEIGIEVNDYYQPPQNSYQLLMRRNSKKVFNHIAANHSERVKNIISYVPDGGNSKDLPERLRKKYKFHTAWTRFCSSKPAPTIDTGHRHHFHYKYNRVPTVRECARLQSFTDDFIFLGNKTQQFRQVGNAVPPLLSQKIAQQLRLYLN